MRQTLTPDLAARFADIALGHVTREYPNKPDHVLAGPADARTPSQLHPVFYGSYDWHSCVHGYWMLAYLLRRFPGIEPATRIERLFDTHFVHDKVAAECAYLAQPTARGFKRPYGWGWLLKLASELAQHPTARWANALAPLAEAFAQRYRDFLPLSVYPVRVGTHFNTAFGLRMAADYAQATSDTALAGLLLDTGRRWYGTRHRLPGLGRAQRGRLSFVRTHRGRVHAPPAAGRRVRALAGSFSAPHRRARAGHAVHAAHGDRPHRRQDRAPRRPEPQPRLVLARHGVGTA
jgi:hypothetical protein